MHYREPAAQFLELEGPLLNWGSTGSKLLVPQGQPGHGLRKLFLIKAMMLHHLNFVYCFMDLIYEKQGKNKFLNERLGSEN